ncbi:MAG: GtrA family protein [Planctomycetia bacterium]|nr:GtrA family protein [Planctomycetia bacterium]
MLSENTLELRRLILFVVMGALNTAICYAVYAALVEFADMNYKLALVADYGFGSVLGYVLHRLSTFADRRNLKQAFGKYTVTLVGAFLLNYLVLERLVERQAFGALAAQAVAMTLATLASFLLQKHWVFRAHGQQEPKVAAEENTLAA